MEKTTFAILNAIDVSAKVEKKMNLSYLSWAWAHAEMKKFDENAEINIHEFIDTDLLKAYLAQNLAPDLAVLEASKVNYRKDNAGAYVTVSVTIKGRTETETLPVMDMKNKSLVNPNSMDVNKAHKRCFVKALALHGLGLYIYSGEDLPEEVKNEEKEKTINERIKSGYAAIKKLDNSLDKVTVDDLLLARLNTEDLKKVGKERVFDELTKIYQEVFEANK
jgi:hypothetical protein